MDFELYSKSIYCSKERQAEPRPKHWNSQSLIKELTKFSWLKIPAISFEYSFITKHDVLMLGISEIEVTNGIFLPFGVRSHRGEHKRYWNNCAIGYLVRYNYYLLWRNHYRKLIQDVDLLKDLIPSHWVQEINDAELAMKEAKAAFKQSRKIAKMKLGLIQYKDLPENTQSILVCLHRLNACCVNAHHNELLFQQSTDDFLRRGFSLLEKQSSRKLLISNNLLRKDVFDILQAYIKESMFFRCFKRDDEDNINEVYYKPDLHCEADLFLSFTSSDGGVNALIPLKNMSDKYKNTPDFYSMFKDKRFA
ncbi:hypothetical protein ACTFQF_00290 [Aliivibrio fischeri]|uniref:hypothetical protein n=1 Tax=Aliivibrio fischeri TaxID=668 RepID=UPI0007C48A58|nr:hypothetical protein [Aliivibrio fischeri]